MEDLREEAKTFIKETLEPKVIGCQSRCPGCGIKCKKSAQH